MSGDGGFGMMMGDFLSLTQLGLPVKVVVFNNGTLGFVEMEMKASGFLDFGVSLQNPNFAAMAQATGVFGVRVERPEEFQDGLRRAFAHEGPALVDVVSARQELAMPPKITAGEAADFSLFALKAVMDGRGRELIDLGADESAAVIGAEAPSVQPERGEIEVEDRFLLDPLVAVLFSDRDDLAHDPGIEAVGLRFAVDVLDIVGERLLFFLEPLDALDEGAQMPGVDVRGSGRSGRLG